MYNGSGVYSLPGPQLASGETVSATENNQFRNDVAEAFNVAFCRDGESLPTANWPMDGFKLTELGAGTSPGDSVRYEQATTDVAITGGTISGVAITTSTGSFTSLSATSVSGSGFEDYLASPPPIGTTTPNNANFNLARATYYQETEVAIAASNINLSLGNYFSKTISGNITFTVSNVPASGTVASFILDLTNAGSAVITWWANVKWAAGAPQTLTASGRDVLGFFTYDGGATWTGLTLARDVK